MVLLLLYGVMFWWPRPPDTTEARVFAADGAQLDYCVLPELDGNGPGADDIPKAYTPAAPNCYYTTFPMPILQHCREPIAEGFPDMRGLWLAYEGLEGHMERIEQCGDRIVVTTHGIIHDFHADGTLKNGSRDTEGATNQLHQYLGLHGCGPRCSAQFPSLRHLFHYHCKALDGRR